MRRYLVVRTLNAKSDIAVVFGEPKPFMFGPDGVYYVEPFQSYGLSNDETLLRAIDSTLDTLMREEKI